MGEVMWIEVLGRHREVASRHRLAGATLAIGRAYDNDLILDDATVAAHHVTIAQDEAGAWFAEDRGSVNGLHVEGSAKREARIALTGGEVLRIGRTLLRLRTASFPVAPERAIGAPTRTWPVIGWCALIAAAVILLSIWLAQTTQPEVSSFLVPLAAVASLLLLWVGFWSLMSRIFAGQARFERHLLVALVALLANLILDKSWNLAAFSLAIPTTALGSAALGWVLLAALAYAHLRVIGPGRLRIKAASVAVMALTALGLQWVAARELQKTTGSPMDMTTLLPPAMRIVPGKDEGAFFGAAGALRARLDKARTEDLKDADASQSTDD
jgi:hypothetical protein